MVPLGGRGGRVRGYVMVDVADAESVNLHRWTLTNGYATRTVYPGRHRRPLTIYLHRALLGLIPGDGFEGDHVNRIRMDCRRQNLRPLRRGKNQQNQRGYPNRPNATSAYRGVFWNKQRHRWMACVGVNGKTVYLGLFRSELDAANAAREGRLRLLPFAVD